MPTYEYRCPEGHEFEHFYRKISDAVSELPCPTCGKLAERRLSGGAGLVFKGSGFYLTDYGKNAHRKSGDSGDKSGSKTGESSSGESKPSDAKSESKSEKSESKPSDSSSKSESKSSESKSSTSSSGSGSSGKSDT